MGWGYRRKMGGWRIDERIIMESAFMVGVWHTDSHSSEGVSNGDNVKCGQNKAKQRESTLTEVWFLGPNDPVEISSDLVNTLSLICFHILTVI